MKYKSFHIEKFKGIQNVDIDLSNNRILTLVGLNESGKTTILEAISLFYKLIKNDDLSIEDLNGFRPKGIDFTGKIKIEGRLLFEEEDILKIQNYWKTELNKTKNLEVPKEFSYTFNFEYKLHQYIRTSHSCRFCASQKGSKKSLFDSDNASWQRLINYIKKDLVPEILFYEDFIFDIPEKIKYSIGKELLDNKTKNKEWQLVLNDILKSVNNELSFQEHIVDIWFSDNNTASNRLSKMEGELNSKITNSWKELFQKNNKKLNFKEIKIKVEPVDAENINFSFEVKTDEDKVFPINERSKGCKWFFSFLLFTEFRKNRTGNILFLLDEPASNLHTYAQSKILEAIKGLSDKSMVIYSTHSEHLINPEWLAGAYVIVNDVLSEESLCGDINLNEGVKITAQKYYTYVGSGEGSDKLSYFQPILNALDYTPSKLELIPSIVILEGKYDWNGYKYFNEIILKNKTVYNFYPGGGKDKLFDIIRLYLSWGREFLVILDGDDGVKSKQKYINEFGEFVKDKVYTLKDIIGQKADLETLIDESDKILLHDTVYGTGSYNKLSSNKKKSNLNMAINKLLWDKTEVNITIDTKNRFQKIIDFIKDKI